MSLNDTQKFFDNEGAIESWREREFSVSVLHRPGKKLDFNEDDPYFKSLIAKAMTLTAESFGQALEEQTEDGTRSHLTGVDALALLYKGDELIGFASAKYPTIGLCYIHGIAIATSAKGKRGSLRLMNALIEAVDAKWIAFTTQNPVMYCVLQSMCREITPSPERPRVHNATQGLMVHLISDRPGVLDPEIGVSRGLYQEPLYKELPQAYGEGSEVINEWFNLKLRVENGRTRDGFIFIGELNR